MPDQNDPLYRSYLAAHRAHQEHTDTCGDCHDAARCPQGHQLFARFSRLQDDYLARQKKRP